jgi:hypothetical protein
MHHDFEESLKPPAGRYLAGALLGAVLGCGLIGGGLSQLGLPGGLFLFIGALFGLGLGVSFTSILAQAMRNSSI